MTNPAQITFRNTSHSGAIEQLIREEVVELERYYDGIVACQVVVDVPHRHQTAGDHYHIGIKLAVPGGEIVVNREPNLHAGLRALEEEEHTKEGEIEVNNRFLKSAIKSAFDTAKRRLQDFARRQRLDVKRHSAIKGATG